MTEQSAGYWVIILGSLVGVITAIAAGAVKIIDALRGVSNKVDALEIKVDGRLTQLLERTALASRAEGVVAGQGQMVIPIVDTSPQPPQELVVPIPVPTPPILLLPIQEKPKEPDGAQ